MKSIAIYVEGGGDTADQKSQIRQGFDVLLQDQKSKAREKGLAWKLVPCGSRNEAFETFKNAINTAPDVLNVLLVDSESPVINQADSHSEDATFRATHLSQREPWDIQAVNPEAVHLMVQCMETWIVADPDALTSFYGQHFNANVLPKRQNLEEESKKDVYQKLESATSHRSLLKGTYGKIKHASQLLQRISPAKVKARCARFGYFQDYLNELIG